MSQIQGCSYPYLFCKNASELYICRCFFCPVVVINQSDFKVQRYELFCNWAKIICVMRVRLFGRLRNMLVLLELCVLTSRIYK
jgi:hypothetical protein